MADEIRCPMCSKTNPAGTETCRFCGARLSTLNQAGSDEPDWLRDFRDSSTGSAEGAPLPWQSSGEADSSSGLPDWLTGGSDAAQESGADLLSRLSGGEKSPESTPGFIHGVEDSTPAVPDWMQGFRAGDEGRDAPAASEPAEPPASEFLPAASTDDEVINWLKSLGNEAPGDLFTDAPTPAQPPDTLAWSEESIADTKQQQTGVTEWLENMAHESPAKPEPSPESEQRFQDWLSSDGVIREEQPKINLPAETEALPDWLSGSAEQGAEAVPAVASQPEEELPAWLSGFGAEEAGQDTRDSLAAAPGAGQPAAPAELPDWLSETAGADTGVSAPADDMSDWLNAIAKPEVEEPEPMAPSLNVPDFSTLFAEERTGSEEHLSPEMFGETPEEPALPLAAAAPPAAETPSQPEPAAPDWLGAFAEAGKEEALPTGITGSLPFIDEGVPAWLNDVQPPAASPVSPPAAGPSALLDDTRQPQFEAASDEPFQVDLPDWLTDFQPGEAEAEVAPGEKEEEADLVHAELPGWVEDLRPLETIVTGESVVAAAAAGADSGREEKLGPLAGMRGVLTGEESAVRFRKLPTYSARLRVSERQRSHAALLQNILDIEPLAKEIPAVPSQAPQYIYRLVIAAVLIVALLAGMIFTDLKIFPAPQPTANDTGLQKLFNQIESLPAGAPVLLAVDYEPGLSGEMQMAASSVVEHLMLRDVRLVIVSTVPSGPILADDLLRLVHPRKNEFNFSTRVANLGYLPGGTTSLLEFARRPSNAAPLSFNGSAVWNGPALQGIQNIQSFALVLVLTDSAETGRAWVEQVQPLLGTTPLSMVSSAQAGPMLLPYHQSGQISGLVTGFLGGAMYEQRSGRVNLANVYWNSYQSGYLAGILLLIMGGIFSAVLNAARKPRRPKA